MAARTGGDVRAAWIAALLAGTLAGAAACGDGGAGTQGDPDGDGLSDGGDAGEADGDAPAADGDPDGPAPACPPAPPGPGEVRARLLGCAADAPSGRLVAGLPGDVVLESARARFVVRTRAEGHALPGLPGGGLVDAVLLGEGGAQAGEDPLRELAVAVDFWLLAPDEVAIEADGAEGEARVTVRGALVAFPLLQAFVDLPRPRVEVTQTFVLRPDAAALEIRTHLAPDAPGLAPDVLAGDIGFWGGEVRPFVPGLGADGLPVSAEIATLGLTPGRADRPTAAAALVTVEPRTLVNASGIKGLLWPSVTVPDGGLTRVRALGLGRDLAEAEAAAREALGGAPAAVLRGAVAGDDGTAEVEVRDGAGAPVTRCAPGEGGALACPVPVAAGEAATLWLGDGNGDGGWPGQAVPGAAAAAPFAAEGGEATVALAFSAPASLAVTAVDGEGAPVPFRLTAQDAAGDRRSFVDADGEAAFRLPAGTWEVWVHHGPEHAEHRETVTLAPGAVATIAAALPRVVDTAGWVAVDLHVHAEQSTDSEAPNRHRLVGALAEGLDVMVATDHDFVTDAGPWLEEAGVAGRLLVVAGAEVSTPTLGHLNAWPLAVDPERAGQGAPDWRGADAPELLARLRAAVGPGGVVQVNHPRFGGAAFFEAIDLDAGLPPAEALAFDALELVNGIGHADTPQVLADWMGLLDAGVRRTGTGASDVHGVGEPLGSPRTLVYVGEDAGGAPRDAPGGFTAAEVWAALRAGRAMVSGGPVLTLEVADAEGRRAGIGERLDAPAGAVTARARLQAPAWMTLGTLRIVSGAGAGAAVLAEEAVGDAPIAAGARDVTVEVALPDGGPRWVVAVHEPAGTPSPGLRRPPWAIANPVFVGSEP